jgi:hypothetical protein
MSASPIDELRAGFEEPFAALGRDAARDGRAVVVSWPSLPVELVRAAGFTPVFARGSGAPTPAADRVLEPGVFPNRLHQLVEAALTGRLAGVAAIVLPRSSDPDYKCFLYLRELARRGAAASLPPVLLFDLLHADSPDARAYNADRLRSLLARLASLAGRLLDTDELRREIESANRARGAARRLQALRGGVPRVAGAEAFPLLGAFWQVEPERYASLAETGADSLSERAPLDRLRVLIAGAPVDGAALHEAIEAEGAVVVAELTPFGSCGTSADVEQSDDAIAALAEHCARSSIDARLPVDALLRKLAALLDGVDAVAISLPHDDASFGFDYPRYRDLLARHAIPHAVVRGNAAGGVPPADRERIRSLVDGARREAARG